MRTERLSGRQKLRLTAFLGLIVLGIAGWRWVDAAVLSYAAASAQLAYDWPQFDGDAQHSGNNTQEWIISPANVASLSRLYQVSLPSIADGAPAYLHDVTTPSGVRDLLFVTTKDGHIIALDASSGAQVWSEQAGAGGCTTPTGGRCYTTSSPVVDPNRQYVYSYGLDGKVHKYQVTDGTEITGGGWPETATLKGFNEKGSSALSLATVANGASYLYVANGGYPGDAGDYQGHITAINLATGAQTVFNTICSDRTAHFGVPGQAGTTDCPEVQSAVWARVGVVYDSQTNTLYAATGNGDYLPLQHDWGDSVFALNPDGTGRNGNPLDSYTPSDYQQLQNGDVDLGSTAPAILPVPSSSNVQHLAVQSGKDALLRLLNLDNLSGHGGPGYTGGEVGTPIPVPQGGEVLTQPAVWVNPTDGQTWVFVATGSGLAGLDLTIAGDGTPRLQPVWQNGSGGSSPIVANGILFEATQNNAIVALDPATGKQLWRGGIGGIHWESPIVANGVLYITDEGSHLSAFAPAGAPACPPTATPTASATLAPSLNFGHHLFLPLVTNDSSGFCY